MNCDNTAILLISHGSSLPYGKETFNDICTKFKDLTGLPTEVGYMKVEEPSLPQAIKNLNSEVENLNRIIALPVFLAPGIHTNIDIPTILGLKPLETDPRCPDGNYPEGHYLYGLEEIDFDGEIKLLSAIGPHPGIQKIIDKRIEEALISSNLDEDVKTAVLLVSHGSRLNYNKEFISEVHRMFAERTEYINSYGFMELVEPNIPAAINKMLDNEENVDRLVVVPVFLAPGVHTTSDIPTILGLKEEDNHSHSHSHDHSHDDGHEHHHHHHHHNLEKVDFDGEILYPEPIGADDLLIEILKEMVEDEL